MYETYPDMVLLDEELPPVNGEELCSYISRMFAIPIMVLVSSEQGLASPRFLEMGADACLDKRLNQRMLLARASSLFRRCGTNPDYSLPRCIELDAMERQVSLGDRIVDLTATEFRLLNCLALNSDRLVPYPELAMGVWGRQQISPSNLKFYLSSLKKKLANGSDSEFDLLNQRGVGLRFVLYGES
jgi:DNA-binding response OmpR family regulator